MATRVHMHDEHHNQGFAAGADLVGPPADTYIHLNVHRGAKLGTGLSKQLRAGVIGSLAANSCKSRRATRTYAKACYS